MLEIPKRLYIAFSVLLAVACGPESTLNPTSLTCEYMSAPMAVDVLAPRLSWINTPASPDLKGLVQKAYRIEVATSEKALRGETDLVWDSGVVESDRSYLVRYAGAALESGKTYYWRVQVTDGEGNVSKWSKPARWGMGLLKPGDWRAQWIGAPWQGEEASREYGTAPLFRKTFELKDKVVSAKAFVTGLGYFEFYANGRKIGDDCLVPNFTNYTYRPEIATLRGITIDNHFRGERVLYLSYDITDELKKGLNTVGAVVGNGFYNSYARWVNPFGSPRFLCQIEVSYADGEMDTIVTDGSWKARESPIVYNDVYHGEIYDANREIPLWASPEDSDEGWEPAVIRKAPTGDLTAHTSPTDKVTERLAPISFQKREDGSYEVDFGKEISGWIALEGVSGQAGDTLDVRYICESPLGVQQYIFKDDEPVNWAPRFTWYVFRRAIIRGVDHLKASQLVAEAVNTDVPLTAEFSTSDTLFTRINEIWQRSQLDNMHGGIASDCPHRERSPYTGDGQVVCPTVMSNFGSAAFYKKWLRDMRDAQNVESGYVPNGAPWQPGCGGGVAWGAAMNVMPWEFYRYYGDIDELRDNYFAMKEQVRYMKTWETPRGTMYSRKGVVGSDVPMYWLNLGDWSPATGLPSDELVHTFYYWYCADRTARAARALGEVQDEKTYTEMADGIRDAFFHAFYQADSCTFGDFGSNVFALTMGVPEEVRPGVVETLRKEIVEKNQNHLNTGIFGTRYLFKVLAENGLNDVAVDVMSQRDMPGFGYWLSQGATVTWEQWDGKNSRNHPMFGGGLVWFYEDLAGVKIDENEPAYKHVIVRPILSKKFSRVHYSNLTPYGRVASTVSFDGISGKLEVTVPVGCRATVYVPVPSDGSYRVEEVDQGTYLFTIQ